MTKKLSSKIAAAALVGVMAAGTLSACNGKGDSALTKAERERAAYQAKHGCGGCKGKSSCKGKNSCGK